MVDDARAQGHDPTNIVSQSRITNLIRKLDFDSENIFDKAVKASNNLFYGTLNCHNNKISGFMWMTSTMRSNFERFGTFLSLDAMKRRMNIHLWPYIAPVVRNEFNNSCVVCEALVFAERNDAYVAILEGLAEMAPGRPRTEVKAIYADEALNQEILEKAGYTKARLFYDHYHLQVGFKEKFSPVYKEVSPQQSYIIYIYK